MLATFDRILKIVTGRSFTYFSRPRRVKSIFEENPTVNCGATVVDLVKLILFKVRYLMTFVYVNQAREPLAKGSLETFGRSLRNDQTVVERHIATACAPPPLEEARNITTDVNVSMNNQSIASSRRTP
jgi:hypothetical protein